MEISCKQTHKTGLKFKLVKSNSCSSRLELAGTGVGELNAVEEMRNIVHGQRNQLYDENEEDENAEDEYEHEDKGDFEHEETVKDMIYKLEAKNFATTTTKPRIIESRCIEKVPRDAKVTINNQTFEKAAITKSSSSTNPFLSPTLSQSSNNNNSADLHNENVTVNNHISILNATAASAESHNNPIHSESIDTVNSESVGCSSNKISSVKPKIIRNKNVDLAIIAVNKKKEIGMKNTKGFSSDSDIESMLLAQNDSNNEIHEISNNHHNNGRKSRNVISSTATTMQSVEMVKNQDKINSAHFVKNHQHTTASTESPSLSLHKSTIETKSLLEDEEQQEQQQQQPVKMVNWGTVGILNKEYFANDNKLVQIKPYDEMEFEEFEVAGEHYDSLNSK